MKIKIFCVMAGVMIVTACTDNVPNVNDPNNIIVEGKAMKQSEFLEKYCAGKSNHETCMKVLQASTKSATRGEMPKW